MRQGRPIVHEDWELGFGYRFGGPTGLRTRRRFMSGWQVLQRNRALRNEAEAGRDAPGPKAEETIRLWGIIDQLIGRWFEETSRPW